MLGSCRHEDGALEAGRANFAPSLMSDIDLKLNCLQCCGHRLRGHARRGHYLITGNSLYWWKGGGDGSAHSSVVAPAPHGLSPALSLRMNAWMTPKKNTKAPNPDRYEPSDDTRFQPANAS